MEKIQKVLPIGKCLIIPRYNYRTISEADKKGLSDFAKRLIKEGQLTPIRVAVFSKEALKDEKVKEIVGKGNQVLIDGERRLLAMEIANKEDKKHFNSVNTETIPIDSLAQYLQLQMTFNMDRQDTTFTEDGYGFKRFIEEGGKKADLLNSISFPQGVNSRKVKLKYVDERTDLIELHPSLHPFLNNGVLKGYVSKPHQGYLVKGFSEEYQIALANEFTEVPLTKSDNELLGFFNRFRVRFDSKRLPFDPNDERLGITEFGTGACTGCKHLKQVEEEEYFGNDPENFIYCYQSKCYEAKTKKQIDTLSERLKEDKIPFVLLGQSNRDYSNEKSQVIFEDGTILIRYYKLVKEGSCPHVTAGIPDGTSASASLPKGKVLYTCPLSSKCPIHHPHKQKEKDDNINQRIVNERSKTEKQTTLLTAIEWGTEVLEIDLEKIKNKFLPSYLKFSFERFYLGLNSEEHKTFCLLIGENEKKPFIASPYKALVSSFKHYGEDKAWIALTLTFMFHDFGQHWEQIGEWGKEVKVNFKKMLETNLALSMDDLETKQQKRKKGWDKKEEILLQKIHNLYFRAAWQFGIYSWEAKNLIEICEDEEKGKSISRLLGVPVKGEYVPSQVVNKLKGRKKELDILFPKFKLTIQEANFLEVLQKLQKGETKNLIPVSLLKETTLFSKFIQESYEMAMRLDNFIAAADFVSYSIKGKEVSLPLMHNDSIKIAGKVKKEMEVDDLCELDKKAKKITFTKKAFNKEKV